MKKTKQIISLISNIRDKANELIIKELQKNGIKGLAPSHGAILNILFKSNERIRMQDIAHNIHKDKSTVTALVNKLSKLGYIKRIKCTEDSRVTYITLTHKGEELMPVFKKISNLLIETTYRNIEENEKAKLLENLEIIYNNF